MFYDNLKRICDSNGLKITPIVAECGGAKGSITNWKNGATPNSDIVIRLAKRLNVSTDTLLLGSEKCTSKSNEEAELLAMFNNLSSIDKGKVIERATILTEFAAERAAQEATRKKPAATVQLTPVTVETPEQDDKEQLIEIRHSVYKVSAGRGFELEEGDRWETIEIPDTPEAQRADYALTISGESMGPVYYDGDIVLVKEQSAVEMGQIGIFILDGSGYIKKFYGDRLVSLNEEYDDTLLSDYESAYCSGRVIGRV